MLKIFRSNNVAYLLAATVMAVSILLPSPGQQSTVSANSSCGDVFGPIPAWLTTRINLNRAVYQQASDATGVPWQLIAAIHYREFNNATTNPANGQGIYQLYSVYHHPNTKIRNEYRQLAHPNTTVTAANLRKQTIWAAEFFQEKARASYTPVSVTNPRNLTKNETDLNLIKSALFSYNGRAGSYANQAAKYGYSSTTHPFEGSPYVMSKFDCARKSMGLITSDGSNSLTGIDTRMGAFTLYARLKGDNYWKNLQPSTNYEPLDSPRLMEIRRDTWKTDTSNGSRTGNIIRAGRVIYFPSKTTFANQMYLRTETDQQLNNTYGIPYSDLKEVTYEYEQLDTPRWMRLNSETRKLTTGTNKSVDDVILANTELYFASKITINGEMFVRTQEDHDANSNKVIPYSLVRNFSPSYTLMEDPRDMKAATDTTVKDVITRSTQKDMPQGSVTAFDSQTTVGDTTYYRTAEDTKKQLNVGVPKSDLQEAMPDLLPLDDKTLMNVTANTRKVLFATNSTTGSQISKNQKIFFTHRAFYKGEWYYQTEYDASRSFLAGVSEKYLAALSSPYYFSLDNPRSLYLLESSQKTNTRTGNTTGKTYGAGTLIKFSTKVWLNGEWYLRTSHDNTNKNHLGIPYRLLGSSKPKPKTNTISYMSLDRPRELSLLSDTQKTNLSTGNPSGNTYKKGRAIFFDTKVTIGNTMYLRTSYDTSRNVHLGIPYRDLR